VKLHILCIVDRYFTTKKNKRQIRDCNKLWGERQINKERQTKEKEGRR
jgi:hypothetical protein